MRKPPPSDTQHWTVRTYPHRSTMNPALGKRFDGLDIEGNPASGIIWYVGSYDKDAEPTTYVLLLDNNGHRNQTAIISADVIKEHLRGLGLCASMEADRE